MVGQILENFIDDDFVQWLCWFWQQLPNQVDTGQRHRALLNHQLEWATSLHQKLKKLVDPYERDFEIVTAMLSSDYAPGGIHSDGWLSAYPEKQISRTYLVPLQITSNNHTVIFRECSDEAVTFNSFMGMGNSGIVNYKQIEPKEILDTCSNIPKDTYDKYLTHLPYDKLQGLTVDSVLPWKVGTAISWPRRNFHCSANYDQTTVRLSLILMTSCNTPST